MTKKEFKEHLEYLVKKYERNAPMKKLLLRRIREDEMPTVRGVLGEINFSGIEISEEDRKLIAELDYNYG